MPKENDQPTPLPRSLVGLKLGAGLFLLAALYMIWTAHTRGPDDIPVNLVASYIIVWGLLAVFSTASFPETCAGFILTSTSVAAVWFALEAAGVFGIVDYRALFQARADAWVDPITGLDPGALTGRRPHLQLSGEMKGNIAATWCLSDSPRYRYDLRYDQYGFRNDSDLQRADIAFLGDSFIEAIEVANTDTVTSALSRFSGKTVANLGRRGVGPQEELLILERYALPLKPRLIVWAFFEGNDLQDLLQYDQQIAFRERQASRWLRRGPTFYQTSSTALYRLICRPKPFAARRSGLFNTGPGDEVRMYFSDLVAPASQNEEAIDRFRRLLAEAYKLARQRDARLALVFVPMALRVYRDVLRFPPDTECLDAAFGDLPDRMGRVAREVARDIAYVDLTPVFVAAAKRGELVHFADDAHWTPAGHHLAAEALNRKLPEIIR